MINIKPPYLGCAYYPEDWPVEEIEKDAAKMKAIGIQVARIAEFAWSRMENTEGVFTFDWLHHVVDADGIAVLQLDLRYLVTVDVDAVGAAVVRDVAPAILDREVAVPARDNVRRDHDVVGIIPAKAHRLFAKSHKVVFVRDVTIVKYRDRTSSAALKVGR